MPHNIDSIMPDADELASLARRRRFKDKLANITVAFGGMFVIVAIAVIFFYLMFEVWPLFKQPDFEKSHTYAGVQQQVSFVDMDEYNSTGMRLLPTGEMQFFRVGDGSSLGASQLPVPAGVTIASVQRGAVLGGLVGVGLSNGQIIVFSPNYGVEYGEHHARTVIPGLRFPYGNAPLTLDESGQAIRDFAIRGSDDALDVLGINKGRLVWSEFAEKKSSDAEAGGLSLGGLSSGGDEEAAPKVYARSSEVVIAFPATQIHGLVIGQDARWAYVLSGAGNLAVVKLKGEEGPTIYQQLSVTRGNTEVTTLAALQGNISLLVGDSTGQIAQWFLVRDKNSETDKFSLEKIRSFSLGDAAVTAITPEVKRKGFVAGDAKGRIGYFFTTSERTLGIHQAADAPIRALAISPRSEGVFVQTDKSASFWSLHAEHPDISMQSTWGKVWYESYPEPTYTWQSTSGSSDFEGKLSLMPLAFGTIKASFYAMALAAPLAICAAMYTAIFMAPGLRRKVKPVIELMQALPTVILGFLAGLWLAPTIEANLPGIFSLLIITPLIILACGFAWSQLSLEKRSLVPEGWVPLLLIVPILLGGWLSFEMSRPVEVAFFGGDIRIWLEHSTGLKFDQRNALIIGLTMGFAVIAPIFSIAEDALFAVPRHLTNGSLALGATQWQTLTRVVLPTASPGIFSAVMIGFGRAVGETMIVLMATGNTAVMEWNIFEGMRTLSANVAVEMGEAEIGSTHFRVLFLSALALFVLTFVVNTAAEIVRSRLRKKYGSL
ncbi:MAG: ABC transporter permease subunit [bacterium]|nr:ABC transporter permease subunit [bacterium]